MTAARKWVGAAAPSPHPHTPNSPWVSAAEVRDIVEGAIDVLTPLASVHAEVVEAIRYLRSLAPVP